MNAVGHINNRVVIILAVLSAFNHPALALTDEECSRAAHLAASIMGARQKGASLDSALKVLSDHIKDPAAADAGKKLILEAYKQPRFNTEENQQRAVDDFRDDVHLACLTGSG